MPFQDNHKKASGLDKNQETSLKKSNFKHLNELIRTEKEIILDSDLVFDDDCEEGIVIDIDDVTIDGGGHSIDSQSKSRIFKITGNNITLKNITLKNGFADKGSAVLICNDASCTFENCNIIENRSSYGGAVYVHDGTVTLSDSIFKDNSAARGAALTNYKGIVTIKNTLFRKNEAYTLESAYRNRGYGGAINNGYGEIKIYDSKLIENYAEYDGGAITNFKGNIIIENCILSKNKANRSYGGAIHNYIGATTTLIGSRLCDNYASKHGGAIYNAEDGTLTIKGSLLRNNSAKIDGGGLTNYKGKLFMENSSLFNNNADGFGGAIYSSTDSNTALVNCKLCENFSGKDGSAIFNDELAKSTVKDSLLKNNFANSSGAIHNALHGIITVTGTKFEDNKSKSEQFQDICNLGKIKLGESVFESYGETIFNEGKLDFCDYAPELEEKICNQGSLSYPLNKNERSFKYLNQLIQNSNEIKLDYDIKFDAINEESEFNEGIRLYDDFIIDGNGHTIDAQGHSRIFKVIRGSLTLKNVVLQNGCSDDGGAIYLKGGTCTIEKSDIQNNNADYGAAIFNENCKLTIFDSEFKENSANNDGGAIYSIGSELKIFRSKFKENSALKYGGVIGNGYGDFSVMTICDCEFTNNSSKKCGGAINNNHGVLTISDSKFNDNSANGGGAIKNNHELIIKNNSFSKNKAYYGGAINNDLGRMKIHDSDFKDNASRWEGGAIYNYSHNKEMICIANCEFTDNSSNGFGGAIHNHGGKLELNHAFISNSKSQNGGALSNKGKATLNNCKLQSNSAQIGGGIYSIKRSSVKCIDVAFYDNCAKEDYTQDIFLDCDAKLRLVRINLDNSAKTILNKGDLYLCENVELEEKIHNQGNLIYPLKENERTFEYLSQLIQNSNAEEIKLDHDIKFDAINGEEEPDEIYGDLIIDGNGHTVNGQNVSGNIYIRGNVTIRNMNLKNCGIYLQDHKSCLLKDSCLKNVQISNMGNFTIEHCIFKNNSSISNSDDLTLKDSTFISNFSINGLIVNTGLANISTSKFLKNGGSDIIHNKNSLKLESTTFKENKSEHIIFNDKRSILSVCGGEISDNKITDSSIYNKGKSCSISLTSFSNNRTSHEDASDIINKSELIIKDAKFNKDVKSILNDGKIVHSPKNLMHNITNNGILKLGIREGEMNDFTKLNDLISNHENNEIILKNDFTFEEYERGIFDDGIKLDSDNLVIDGQNHTINGSKLSRIFVVTGKNITLKNINFINGYSYKNRLKSKNSFGGAIKVCSNANLFLYRCKFYKNKTGNKGGAIYNRGNLEIEDSSFCENSSNKFGGAISNYGKLTIWNSDFIKNQVIFEGGAINNNGELRIYESYFLMNRVNSRLIYNRGGAINNSGEINIINTEFVENTAVYGGAIINKIGGTAAIRDCSLIKNIANHKGGAIDNWDGTLIVQGSYLARNTANFGGAILSSRSGNLEIKDCRFSSNYPENVRNR